MVGKPSAFQCGGIASVATYTVLGFWAVVCLFPLYWIAATTLKQPLDVINGPRFLPFVDFKPTLDAWAYILFNPQDDTLRRYVNSVVVAFASTGLTVLFGGFAAFGLMRSLVSIPLAVAGFVALVVAAASASTLLGASVGLAGLVGIALIAVAIVPINRRARKHKWTFDSGGILFAILASRILPPVVTVLPVYYMVDSVHLLDTQFALALTYTAANLPIAVWLLRGFFAEVPLEIEEAAQLDGASRFRIFFVLVVPLTRAGIATALLVFVLAWNEYLLAVYLTSDHALTMPPFLAGQMATREQMASADPEWGYFSVLIVLMVAPLVLFAGIAQKVVSRSVRV